MKKSINIWSFSAETLLADKFILARDAGFEGFEVDLSEDGPVNMTSTNEELSAVRRMAENLNIRLSGLATGLYWSNNAASSSFEIRKQAITILDRQLKCAHLLGIDTVLVVPGTVGVDFIPNCEVVPYEVAYQRATDFIGQALPAAEKYQVRIGIENVWNKFLLSPLEMRGFIDQFSSEWVGAYFDVGNALATGYPEHWIEILGDRILRVHVKDYRRAVGSAHGFCDLLSGDVNWPHVMQSLFSNGYTGWLTAEMIPPVPFYKHHPSVLIYNASRAMDALLSQQIDSSHSLAGFGEPLVS